MNINSNKRGQVTVFIIIAIVIVIIGVLILLMNKGLKNKLDLNQNTVATLKDIRNSA